MLGGFILVKPGLVSDSIGLAVLAVVFSSQYLRIKKHDDQSFTL